MSTVPGFSLFISNITFDTSLKDLYKIFGKYKKISNVYIPWDWKFHRHRGFGFIRFLYATDVYAAMGVLNGKRVDGRILTMDMANPRKDTQPRKSNKLDSVVPTPISPTTNSFLSVARDAHLNQPSRPIRARAGLGHIDDELLNLDNISFWADCKEVEPK
ncbi:serine/arginine-rich splicing factor SC35-like [Magnolia sinica]|uniref:serine/arginine-rich splicing factor SC35-like n=1 Tax=Magnolia sinica TaxID=86752 RepID=UPI00265B2AFA|nr:serine/arginine-rich splicing factor SC35-like [Magnolia sinica]